MKKIGIINGVNLNLLGKRETDIYGNTSFEQYFKQLKGLYPQMELSYYQSNIEGALVSQLQEWGFTYDGIVLNAGAYTHTSIALADAIKAITTPVVEVHISNTFAREAFRHHSYLSPVVAGIIVGFGLKSYNLAIESFI
ncbi:3-dehydroquinate dehydratase [Capnocytophaga haemolytica]|uniref:3-dehydroquinate dehydratase n=1 Tax=Capnocytophaga haemolytica TaxID=45243 RepID=A0AAX2GYS0_9FLAO|nr:type II 3-dehydroquinate dehydratase [Capnocytophaga haemolytica]AMD84939.1 3-dehydroquinate dehydratase [Capnocytophaga haemolytica]SFO32432.1 3-dehydroquinate dehydratase [Capnocytophaga haemolytica]SNV06279.1 3-dehydroquinate dehydratase [Capnocytophaga haemolytica]